MECDTPQKQQLDTSARSEEYINVLPLWQVCTNVLSASHFLKQGARIKQNSSPDSIKMGSAARDFAICKIGATKKNIYVCYVAFQGHVSIVKTTM